MSRNYLQWPVKYRPKSFEAVVGNEAAITRARKIAEKRDTHAILMHGESGTGKTTIGRLIANSLTDTESDILEENIANKNGIDDMRSWISQSSYLPVGDCRVFLLDEVHRLGKQAQSALLKELEEPKHDRVVWILCTNHPHLLDTALADRLYKIEVRKPDETALARHLFRILRKEEALTQYEDKQRKRVCIEIARATDCVPRESIQLLKEIADAGGEYSSFKELVLQGIRQQTDNSIDKIALQTIMSIYSDDKPVDFRADYLLKQLADRDIWALLTRLVAIHYDVVNTLVGVQSPASYYYIRELKPMKGVPTSLQETTHVSCKLADIRNNLQNVAVNIPHYVVPQLLQLVYDVDKLRRRNEK